MEFFEVVKKRKSVRKYLNKSVLDKDIKKILEMVNIAPSAGNLQPFKVYVIENKEMIDSICLISGGIQRNFESNPPLILIFCANPEESRRRYKERGANLYCIQDTTIACAYAQLTATALGFSACWVGSFDEEKIKDVIKTDLLPIAILTAGYSDEKPTRPKRKLLDQISVVVK
jgi:nitroreductase